MTKISELLVKIGADAGGLHKELGKIHPEMKKAFGAEPITEMQNALTGTAGTLETLISKFGGIITMTAGGFGLFSLVESAAKAGEATYQLSQRLGVTTAEAGKFSKILKFTGADVDTASTAFMRLDKTLMSGGQASKNIKAMLNAVGVSITDQSGKLLPLNQQLEQLAQGYQRATKAGYGQEFLMQTLGSRGLSMAKTLADYNNAVKNVSKVQGIGLNPKEMHELNNELKIVQMQFGQLGNVGGMALAPIAKELIPPILKGLGTTAGYIAKNRRELTAVIKLIAILTASIKAAAVAKKLFAAAKSFTPTKEIAAEVALTKSQERSITRRLKMIERQAVAEERAYLKTLKAAKLSDDAKNASFTEYCIKRNAKLDETLAREEARMRTHYQKANLEKVQSELRETQAIGVTEKAASKKTATIITNASREMQAQGIVNTTVKQGSAEMIGLGTKSVETGIQIMSMTRGAVSGLGLMKNMVLSLTGGWIGLALAIGAATWQLYSYLKADEAESMSKDTKSVIIGKQKYYYSKRNDQWMNIDEYGHRKYVMNGDSRIPEIQKAWEKEHGSLEKYKNGGAANLDAQLEQNSKELEELKKQLKDTTAELGNVGGGIASGSAASVEIPKQTYQIERPIGESVVDYANSFADGLQWIGPFTSDASVQCASFVSELYKANGILGLWSANVDDLANQFGSAYHEVGSLGELKSQIKEGDMIKWDAHTGVYVGNGMYRARNSSGGVHTGTLEEGEQWFGRVQGYGSISEYTGGRTSTFTTDDAGRAEQERLKKLNEAKDQAIRIFAEMSKEIESEQTTAYSKGMSEIAENVRNKSNEINKLENAGIPTESIKLLKDKLAEYENVMKAKVVKAWQENMSKMTAETKKANAEMSGDFKTLADVEYETAKQALDKEREERFKQVAKNKDDKEAMNAVNEWYTEQEKKLAEQRTEAYRESYKKQLELFIKNQDFMKLKQTLNEGGQNQLDFDGRAKALEKYKDLWNSSHISMGDELVKFTETTQSAFKDMLTGVLDGTKDFGDAFMDMVTNIGQGVLEQLTQNLSSRITQSLLGGAFENVLGGQNGEGNNVGFGGLGLSLFGGPGGAGQGGLMQNSTNLLSRFNEEIKLSGTAIGLFGGGLDKSTMLTTGFNLIQSTINTATKPAEIGATTGATGALATMTASAAAASHALSTIAVTGASGGGGGLFGGVLGIGRALLGFSTGGAVFGIGNSTSDDIPAMLSNGEYVLNAAAVQRIGIPLLDAMNSGKRLRFARGGAVNVNHVTNSETTSAESKQISVNFNVRCLDSKEFMRFLRESGARSVKQVLFEDNRNFNNESELW